MESVYIFVCILIYCFIFQKLSLLSSGYDLTIVHNNDVHAHYDQTSVYSGDCSDTAASEGKCYGGEARRVTVIQNARANIPNTVVLDAGDRFVGTLWFTTYKGMASAHFVNKEGYDAMCLGNHEFDIGLDGLVPFLDNLTVPVLDANIDVSGEPRLQGKLQRSLVIERGGEKIGILGVITPRTSFISSPGPTVKFTDVVEATRTEVDNLKAAGAKIIIALTHIGYKADKLLAEAVDGIDVVVGGHSHSFLFTGEQPSTEEIEGPYPTVVHGPSGKTVLIVQAYAWGKYMGILNVTFDENFDVQSWSGSPLLLDATVTRDADTLADIERMVVALDETRTKVVGSTAVKLEGNREMCRARECNMGNLITDAWIWYHIDKREFNDTWALASIALSNSGGIRTSAEPGTITQGHLLTIQPFGNTIDLITLKGIHLRQAFEHAVGEYDPTDLRGAFFQMSGARVQYDLSKDPGSRVVSVDVRCLRCTVLTYSPLDDEEEYRILLQSFIIGGGDGYRIKDHLINKISLNSLDVDVLAAYLQSHPLVFPETEGRIKFVNSTSEATSTVASTSPQVTMTTMTSTERQPGPTGHPIIVHRCPDTRTNSAPCLNLSLTLLFLTFILLNL